MLPIERREHRFLTVEVLEENTASILNFIRCHPILNNQRPISSITTSPRNKQEHETYESFHIQSVL
jgi:hypothetical protein